jgi:hypothetical protein
LGLVTKHFLVLFLSRQYFNTTITKCSLKKFNPQYLGPILMGGGLAELVAHPPTVSKIKGSNLPILAATHNSIERLLFIWIAERWINVKLIMCFKWVQKFETTWIHFNLLRIAGTSNQLNRLYTSLSA